MKEYKRQHIIKHALEAYVQRPGVSDKDLKQELAVLEEVKEDIADMKEKYDIKDKPVLVENRNGPFRIRDSWGEINALSNDDVINTIHNAWNYEADVYEMDENGQEDLIFHGWLDNETLSEMLEKYDLRVIDKDGFRYLQTVSTGEVHVAAWQKQ